MQMPPFVKFVHYVIAVSLLALAAWAAWHMAVDGAPIWHAWLPVICAIAAVGLLRRVAWGRFLVSCISVLCAIVVAATLIPINDDHFDGGGVLKRLIGFMPPLWLAWSLVIVSVTLVLLPAVVIGWRKHWFRADVW
jgi:hypothetical protein